MPLSFTSDHASCILRGTSLPEILSTAIWCRHSRGVDPAIGEAVSYKPLVRYQFFLYQTPRLEDHAASGGESGVLLRSIVPPRRIHRDLASESPPYQARLLDRAQWGICPGCTQAVGGEYHGRVIARGATLAAKLDAIRRRNPQRRSAGGFHAAGAADRFHRMGWQHIGHSDHLAKACASNRARTRKGVWGAREVPVGPGRRRGWIAGDLAVRG